MIFPGLVLEPDYGLGRGRERLGLGGEKGTAGNYPCRFQKLIKNQLQFFAGTKKFTMT